MIVQRLFAAALFASSVAASAQYTPYPPQYPQDGYAQQQYEDGQQIGSVEAFYEPLSRYGRWVETRWGRAWQPSVDRNWRPFTIGRWEDTAEFGRVWRSDEPWGWATYHYGRWGFDQRFGWIWVPDTVWGPGWVAWRDGDEYAGWAPLPPQISIGFGFGGFASYGYDQWYEPSWVYVPRGYLYGRSVTTVILPYNRNREWWGRTRDVTHYEREGGHIVNRSFDRDRGRDRDRDRGRDSGRDPRGFNDARGRPGDDRGRAPDAGGVRYGQPALGRPGYPAQGYGQRPDGDRRGGNERPGSDRAGNDRAGNDRPGSDRGSPPVVATGTPWQSQGGRPPRDEAALNRPPAPDATRPYWDRRRAEAFQPATGGNAPVPGARGDRGRGEAPNGGGGAGFNRGAPGGGERPRAAPPPMAAPPAVVARPQVQVAPPQPRPAPPAERPARVDRPQRSGNDAEHHNQPQ